VRLCSRCLDSSRIEMITDVWDFGGDCQDDDWIGEPASGIYDEDDTDEEEEDEMMEHTDADAMAMDQDVDIEGPPSEDIPEDDTSDTEEHPAYRRAFKDQWRSTEHQAALHRYAPQERASGSRQQGLASASSSHARPQRAAAAVEEPGLRTRTRAAGTSRRR
jgi:F-box and WD-40 domain protein CDC4